MLIDRLKSFKKAYEELRAKERWKVFFDDDFDEEMAQGNTVYFTITGDDEVNKEKYVDFSIYYCKSSTRKGFLEFRDEVRKFVKYLQNEFEDRYFYADGGYRIEYFTIKERAGIRFAEIQARFNCTLDRDIEVKRENMEKLILR